MFVCIASLLTRETLNQCIGWLTTIIISFKNEIRVGFCISSALSGSQMRNRCRSAIGNFSLEQRPMVYLSVNRNSKVEWHAVCVHAATVIETRVGKRSNRLPTLPPHARFMVREQFRLRRYRQLAMTTSSSIVLLVNPRRDFEFSETSKPPPHSENQTDTPAAQQIS